MWPPNLESEWLGRVIVLKGGCSRTLLTNEKVAKMLCFPIKDCYLIKVKISQKKQKTNSSHLRSTSLTAKLNPSENP